MAKQASKKLRVAFIGAGGIAGAHLKEYTQIPEVEIVGLADPKPAGMKKLCEQYKIPAEACFADYHKMLRTI